MAVAEPDRQLALNAASEVGAYCVAVPDRDPTIEEPLLPASDASSIALGSVGEELIALAELSAPLIAQCLMAALCTSVCFALIGLSEKGSATATNMAAASLAGTFSGIFGSAVGFGLLSGMSTFCSAANGSGLVSLNAVCVQRALVMMTIAFVPIILIHLMFGPFLLHVLGMPRLLSMRAASYVYYLLIGMPFDFLSGIMSQVLLGQSNAAPIVVCAIICSITNVALCFLFLRVLKYDFTMAAGATAISQVIGPFLLLAYIIRTCGIQSVWIPWKTSDVLHRDSFVKFIGVCLSSFVQVWGQCVCFGVNYVLAGWISETAVAANAILSACNALQYMIYHGISLAASIRVGNFLGAQRPLEAERCATICLVSTTFICGVLSLATGLMFTWIASLFTRDTNVIDLAGSCVVPLVLSEIGFSMLTTAGGIQRGSACQLKGASWLVIGSCVGLPLSYFLSPQYGLVAVWYGNATCLCIAGFANLVVVMRINWIKQSLRTPKIIDAAHEA